MENEITLSKIDYWRLNSLILRMLDKKDQDIRELNFLNIEIKRAKKVESRKITPDIVTMDTQLEATFLNSGKTMILSLVYPQNANYKEGLISVLSPLGRALLGCKAGETISFKSPGGIFSVRIDKIIFQPEANGKDLV